MNSTSTSLRVFVWEWTVMCYENTLPNGQQPILISWASALIHIQSTSTLSQPSLFDLCEAPSHTRDVAIPSLMLETLFPPPPSLSSLVSSWPTSLVATSAMTSLHRWCHGRFAPLKAKWLRLLPSLPLTFLFPTANSLTPSSPASFTPTLFGVSL